MQPNYIFGTTFMCCSKLKKIKLITNLFIHLYRSPISSYLFYLLLFVLNWPINFQSTFFHQTFELLQSKCKSIKWMNLLPKMKTVLRFTSYSFWSRKSLQWKEENGIVHEQFTNDNIFTVQLVIGIVLELTGIECENVK